MGNDGEKSVFAMLFLSPPYSFQYQKTPPIPLPSPFDPLSDYVNREYDSLLGESHMGERKRNFDLSLKLDLSV